MKTVVHLPFQSYHRLNQWYRTAPRSSEFEDRRVDLWYKAMKYHFEHDTQVIRVFDFGNTEERKHYADIQFEVVIEGHRSQVYLMTLVTEQFADTQKAFSPELVEDLEFGSAPLEELSDPFSLSTLLWDSDVLTPDEVTKAVTAWSEKFWPDFECEYRYERLEPFEDWSMGSKSETHCRVLLQADRDTVDWLRDWAMEHGASECYHTDNYQMIFVGLPVDALERLKVDWPQLEFVTGPDGPGPSS